MKILLFFLGVAFSPQAFGHSAAELLRQFHRPDVQQTLAISESEWADELKGLPHAGTLRLAVLGIYHQLAGQIFQWARTHDVFLMSRDMDALRDMVHILGMVHPELKPLAERVHGLQVSRRFFDQQDLAQGGLRTAKRTRDWLENQGLSFERVVRGEQQAVILDHGYLSKAFKAIFGSLLLGIPRDDPEWRVKAVKVFEQVRGRLLSTYDYSSSVPAFLEGIQNGKYGTPVDAVKWLVQDHFIFDTVPFGEGFWNSVGLPSGGLDRARWLIENIERKGAHWVPRIIVIPNGNPNEIEYEDVDSRDARVNRVEYIRRQWQAWRYASSPEVQAITRSWFASQAETAVLSLSKQVSPPPSVPYFTDSLGKRYRIDAVIKNGSSREVVKLVDEEGRVFSLKKANSGDERGRDSVHSDIRATATLGQYSVNHSRIVAQGKDYVIREWVEGITGREFLYEWSRDGVRDDDGRLISLGRWLDSVAAQGLYIGELRPSSMIYTGREWVVINPGRIVSGLAPWEAREKFVESFERRWAGKYLPEESCREQLLRILQRSN